VGGISSKAIATGASSTGVGEAVGVTRMTTVGTSVGGDGVSVGGLGISVGAVVGISTGTGAMGAPSVGNRVGVPTVGYREFVGDGVGEMAAIGAFAVG